MKVAFAFLEDRIAPVFDTARRIHIADAEGEQLKSETQESLPEELPLNRARHLAELGIETLVCGAISNPMLRILAAQGITVIPFVAGELREVIQAWLQGKLECDAYRMPGCRRRGRIHQEGPIMNMQRSGRGGAGSGQGRGGGGKGGGGGARGRGCGSSQGAMGQGAARGSGRGRSAGGTGESDVCLCPSCGHREPHEQGMPCNHKLCPECGTAMTRECPLF